MTNHKNQTVFAHPTSCSRLPIPDSRFPIPDSLLPTPYSLFPNGNQDWAISAQQEYPETVAPSE
ncbi:hypothetical protein [Moorena producens]|uniref:hypothetical protein n=1 Tax=Moorena producens TaxID=1155739 RepID=UPI001314A033|nr:hypothetical protein [Moorena producens]